MEELCRFVRRKDFRDFVKKGVTGWCGWRYEQARALSRLQCAREGETREDEDTRLAQIDALEKDPNYRLVAVADDERLTLDSKCALVALYWYRQKGNSRTLCPTPEPPAEVGGSTEPFELLLVIGDSREPSRFDAIDIVTQDVIARYPDREAATSTSDGQEKSRHVKGKRSTERGEAHAKLIAALTMHHNYANDSCLNTEPIGNNDLAELAKVSKATASTFFTKKFHGHAKYRAMCGDVRLFVATLKLLNQEYSPWFLFGSKPPGEGEYDDE